MGTPSSTARFAACRGSSDPLLLAPSVSSTMKPPSRGWLLSRAPSRRRLRETRWHPNGRAVFDQANGQPGSLLAQPVMIERQRSECVGTAPKHHDAMRSLGRSLMKAAITGLIACRRLVVLLPR